MKQSCAVAMFFVAASAMECNATSTPTVPCLEPQCASSSANGLNGDEVSMLQISKQAASERNLRILQNSIPQKVAGYTTFNLSFEGDCFGNNMQVIESTTTSACASECDSSDECAGFSFGMSTRCVLKGKSCSKEQAVDDGWAFYKKAATTMTTTTTITTTTTTKQCTCTNGQGARGAACAANGAPSCASCDNGYTLTSGACQANQCKCTNGGGATGAACTANGAAECARCDNGYTLTSGACQANQCTCTNGGGATGAACTANGAAKCASCDNGYTLTSGACQANQCTCTNGAGATGAACTANGAAKCASCDNGYTLASGACQANPPAPTPLTFNGSPQAACEEYFGSTCTDSLCGSCNGRGWIREGANNCGQSTVFPKAGDNSDGELGCAWPKTNIANVVQSPQAACESYFGSTCTDSLCGSCSGRGWIKEGANNCRQSTVFPKAGENSDGELGCAWPKTNVMKADVVQSPKAACESYFGSTCTDSLCGSCSGRGWIKEGANNCGQSTVFPYAGENSDGELGCGWPANNVK